MNRGRGTERGCLGKAVRLNRDGAEDDRAGTDNGRGGARATGPRLPGKQKRRQGGAPQGQTRGQGS